MAMNLTEKERREKVREFLQMRNPFPSESQILNAMFLADREYMAHNMTGQWQKQFGNIMLNIKQNILSSFNHRDFRDFIRKQEFLAKSGRIPKGENVGAVLNEN
jgi:hypothetical protein